MKRTYEYFCEENGKTIEVQHDWKVKVVTWGQLCEILEVEPGDTPENVPVTRLMSAPTLLTQKPAERRPGLHPIGCSCGCGSGDPKMEAFQSKTMQAAKKDLKPLALKD